MTLHIYDDETREAVAHAIARERAAAYAAATDTDVNEVMAERGAAFLHAAYKAIETMTALMPPLDDAALERMANGFLFKTAGTTLDSQATLGHRQKWLEGMRAAVAAVTEGK